MEEDDLLEALVVDVLGGRDEARGDEAKPEESARPAIIALRVGQAKRLVSEPVRPGALGVHGICHERSARFRV